MNQHIQTKNGVCRYIGRPVDDAEEYIPVAELVLTLAAAIGAMYALQAAARAIADYLILPYWYGIWPR